MPIDLVATECRGGRPTSYSNKVCRCDGCRELFRVWGREKYANNRERQRARNRESYQRNRVKRQEEDIVRRFGISAADKAAMADAQGGVCAVCKRSPDQGQDRRTSAMHIDHCHESGRIRGLLCAHCNRGLGHFKDNLETLRNAIKYLEGTKP